MTYLCVRCKAAIPEGSTSCPGCQLQFRTAVKAGTMALFIPGGGYFYTGNTLYGLAFATLELLFASMLVLAALDVYEGLEGSRQAFFLLLTALGALKAISFSHSRGLTQGYFPVHLPSS